MKVSPAVMQEVKRIVEKSEICKEDDAHWPEPNDEGRQELEVIMNGRTYYLDATPGCGGVYLSSPKEVLESYIYSGNGW